MPSGFDANHPACHFLGFLLWLFPAIIHEPTILFVLLKERACLESEASLKSGASLVTPVGKKSACSAGFDSWVGKIPWILERAQSIHQGNGNPLQYSCLENPMDRGAWQATVHGVTKSGIRLSDLTTITVRAQGGLCLLSQSMTSKYPVERQVLVPLVSVVHCQEEF